MGKYNFVSVGGQAANAIQELLMERERAAMEARKEELFRDQQAATIRQKDEDQKRLRMQEERIAAEQRADRERQMRLDAQAQEDRETAKRTETNQAGVRGMMADALTQGPLTPDSAKTIGIMGFRENMPVPGIVQQALTPPKPSTVKLGEGDILVDEVTGRRVASGPAKQQPQVSEAQQLANELRRIQVEEKQGKLEADKAWRDKTGEESKRVTEGALAQARRLKMHPGLPKAYGIIDSRTAGFSEEATDAGAIRDQLVAALALPNLGALKGPMSDKDVLFVKQLATRLANTNMSDAEAARAVDEAITFLESKSGSPAGGGDADHPPIQKFGATYVWDGSRYVRQ